MRMGNPSVRRWVSKSQRGEIGMEIQPATYKGVYGKATLFALLTIVSAIATELIMLWAINSGKITEALITVGIATAVCFVPLLIMSFVIAFVPTTAKVLGFVYAVLQGGLLGLLALFVDMFYPGIAFAGFRYGDSIFDFACRQQTSGSKNKQQIYARAYDCVFQYDFSRIDILGYFAVFA